MSTATVKPSSVPDLLTGPILPLLLRFALPNMVAMLAVALAAMAETGYVGQFGPSALAGMALVFPFVMLQNMLSAGAMGGGVSSAVSRALGAGDGQRANLLAVHALWIGISAGIFFMVLMEVLGPWFMSALGGKGEALAHAVAYSEVAFAGSIFIWVVNTLSSVIRGSGNMLVPSVTLVLVALAQVFIGGALGLGWLSWPPLGMQGVAAGAVFANAAGALFLWTYLSAGHGKVKLRILTTRLVGQHLKDILRVGAIACFSPLQTVLTILILTRLVTTFGTEALAGYGIGTRLEFLLVPIAFAIGVASVPLVGMAIGAGNSQRARQAAWTAAALATVILGALGLVVAVAPRVWTTLFTHEPTVIQSSASYFLWAGPFYGLFGLGLSLYFSSLGAGKATGPVLAGTLRLAVVASGGSLLAYWHSPAWMIFALVGLGMAVYGISTVLFVKYTPWGVN
ncbi:MATE family efflux transporter [Limnohabitans sp.]|uniref:MATE family efflux transporter n=1 Tax=Limnohabitans sp. TaxID=1907725 RepID=UPI00286EE986|nr:MATE family efflux transporter [Limnohabitans sp.]